MCFNNDENSSHLFFQCSFARVLWHFWWEIWSQPCRHASSLVDLWNKLGNSTTKTSFLHTTWSIGPSFIISQIWLECNRRIFLDKKLQVQQVWRRILGVLQETLATRCDLSAPMDPGGLGIIQSLGLPVCDKGRMRLGLGCGARGKVQRDGNWLPPPLEVLKINTDGSSRGNPSHVGVEGIGRDALELLCSSLSIVANILTISWRLWLVF